MRAIAVALAVLAGALTASGEGGPVFQMDYSNPGLVPSQWTLELHPDGSGHFHSARGKGSRLDGQVIEAPDIDRDFQLSAEFAAHVFQIAQQKKRFQIGCESHLKVAFQGIKKLSYRGPDGQGACEFNYSKDREIQSLGDRLVSVANTIVEGARLQALLQHDPLGLDRELEVLTESATDGQLEEIGCIRDILDRLAGDPAVMERVRRRARALLAKARN